MKSIFTAIKNFRAEKCWDQIAAVRLPNLLLICLLAFVFTFPLIALRCYHYEEGLTVAFAREALDGDVFYPEVYGFRFNERPVMLSWLAAAISYPFGEVNQITVRLPVVIFYFLSMWMIFRLVSQHATRRAALFAALLYAVSPLVMVKNMVAESDISIAATQFAAFFVWWSGYRNGKVGLVKWLTIGVLLAIAALFKGPQQVAFFAIGVGVFHLWHKDWRELPGFAMAGIISLGTLAMWYRGMDVAQDADTMLAYMRLKESPSPTEYLLDRLDLLLVGFAQWLPASFLAFPLLTKKFRRTSTSGTDGETQSKLIKALCCYAFITTIILFLWPGANVRYAMPAIVATSALIGLFYERLLKSHIWITRTAICFVLGLGIAQIINGWVAAPLLPEEYRKFHASANVIDGAMHNDKEETLYAQFRLMDAILAYIDRPISYLSIGDIANLPDGSAALITSSSAESLESQNPGSVKHIAYVSDARGGTVLVRIHHPDTKSPIEP